MPLSLGQGLQSPASPGWSWRTLVSLDLTILSRGGSLKRGCRRPEGQALLVTGRKRAERTSWEERAVLYRSCDTVSWLRHWLYPHVSRAEGLREQLGNQHTQVLLLSRASVQISQGSGHCSAWARWSLGHMTNPTYTLIRTVLQSSLLCSPRDKASQGGENCLWPSQESFLIWSDQAQAPKALRARKARCYASLEPQAPVPHLFSYLTYPSSSRVPTIEG